MRLSIFVPRLLASAVVLCASGGAVAADPIEDTLKQVQQQIDALNKKGQYTVNTGSLAIESWLLTSTAIDSTAINMQKAVDAARIAEPNRSILVVSGTEPLDFSQVAMLQLEIDALTLRLKRLSRPGPESFSASSLPALAGAVIGLLKSDVQLDAINQDVPAALLAASVAGKLGNAFVPSAAIAAESDSKLIKSFMALMVAADQAQEHADENEQEELKLLLARYDSLSSRLLTPNQNGVAPLAFAARLQQLIEGNPYVLRVNTEKAGGTLLKRTNVVTALGGESVFISGGLVSSYQLTDPKDGRMVRAGVITCRTTLTSLKRVQNASWSAIDGRQSYGAKAICSP